MIRRPPRSTPLYSSAASDVYKRQGLILLSGKQKTDNYSLDDIILLESAQAIVSVAVKNASLYEQAKYDACTDSLTGIFNRKSFISTLENETEKCKETSLTLL